ncbi:MAG: hypothetical protein LBB78_09765 [Spirochaetaceae bacterium]|jgi:hypothetical protein|nr:hypothetical protein [Spirochaetaceae bacterium]
MFLTITQPQSRPLSPGFSGIYQDNRAKKKLFRGITALVLLGSLVLAGCGGVLSSDEEGYTFRFKVDNDTNLTGASKTISKVEFINGDRQNDKVLYWAAPTLAPGNRSMLYIVPGFTVEYDYSTRKCGVKVTFDDGTAIFGWGYFGHENKVLVTVDYSLYWDYYSVSFSLGNW